MALAVLSSMTGYARCEGETASVAWSWELKTVNSKGFELRLRVPPGFDALETIARSRLAGRIRRGTVQASLNLQRSQAAQTLRVNRENLEALMAALAEIDVPARIRPASLDGLLAVPGVVEQADSAKRDDGALTQILMAGLGTALDRCIAMREQEGQAIGAVLRERLDAIARLTQNADHAPGRQPEAIRKRLRQRLSALMAEAPTLDETRLFQEAILIAAKADVREELDRLVLHRTAAAALLEEGGAVGRRLDFIAQELSREAGTLCAKSNDGDLTLIGLDLRMQIDQFREQVQNLE